jgi:hypothetical protein
MKKFLTSVAILASLSGTAVADQLSWDASWGASTSAGSQFPINELVVAYNSQSLVTDNGDGVLSAGDTIQSFGGFGPNGFNALNSGLDLLGLGTLGSNNVGSFAPNPFPTMDGYGTDYAFTFFFNDLIGTYNGTDFVYNSGTLQFGLVSLNAANTGLALGFHNLFDLSVTSGGPENTAGQAQQVFNGTVGNFANNAGNDFTLNHNGSAKSLTDWAALGDVRFSSNQTVNAGFAGFPSAPLDIVYTNGTAVLAANHTGRMSLEVPEPTTLAILGLGLLGMAGASRRKAK